MRSPAPIAPSASPARGKSTSARGSRLVPGALSITRTCIPSRRRAMAVVNPTGPAPTTSTSSFQSTTTSENLDVPRDGMCVLVSCDRVDPSVPLQHFSGVQDRFAAHREQGIDQCVEEVVLPPGREYYFRPGGAISPLGRDGLDDVQRRRRSDDARNAHVRRSEEFRVLLLRPFLAAVYEQHREIEQLAGMRDVPWGDRPLDEEETSVVPHRPTAVAQQHESTLVGPVVDDALEQVDLPAGGDLLEEVTAHERATLSEPRSGQLLAGGLGHVRRVVDDSCHVCMGAQDRAQIRAVATTDVDDTPHAGEV